MPSMLHEGLLLLFRNRPALAPDLLRDVLGVPLPDFTEARVDSAELTEVVPTQYRADLVVLLSHGKPVYAIVVEVQLQPDEDKRSTWPLYLAGLRSRVGCPTALLVVTPDAGVAAWAAQPIPLGHPGFVLSPLVLGPQAMPVVTEERMARQDPELAVLSGMAHGQEASGLDIAKAVFGALGGLDDERARLYLDLVFSRLNAAAKSAFEAVMQGNYEYQSDFARKYYGQGRDAGRCEEARQAIIEVLDARGLAPTAEQFQRIESCADLTQLKAWLRGAVRSGSVSELFDRAEPAE
jgi:hypothetical protein